MRIDRLRLCVLAIGLVAPRAANAACSCVCVNGQTQPLCTSSFDRPAVCLSSPCPIVPHSSPPPISRLPPPIGASSCRLAQVDGRRGYSWPRMLLKLVLRRAVAQPLTTLGRIGPVERSGGGAPHRSLEVHRQISAEPRRLPRIGAVRRFRSLHLTRLSS